MLCTAPHFIENYVNPVTSHPIPYYIFHENISWEKDVLDDLCEIYNYHNSEIGELKTRSLFIDIWSKLFLNFIKQPTTHTPPQHLDNLKNMITYIQDNYTKKISLHEIANVGFVGKSTCCNLFKKYTHKSPAEYLIHYRIQKSLLLLKDTSLSITQVGYEVGFSGTSYYSETFKKIMKMTPTEYRKHYA